MLLLEIFADRGDFGEIAAIIEFERRHLAMRIAFQMLGLTIFALAQIDGLLRHLDALLGHEHADNARIRPDRVVKLHGVLLSLVFAGIVVDAVEQAAKRIVKSAWPRRLL